MISSLTDQERQDLSKKNADKNKQSADNARARGGR